MARIIEPFEQFFDGEGDPLTNGWLKFTESGTNATDRDTYADVNLTIPNTNPLQLDSEGRCPNVFGTGLYRVTLFQDDDSSPGIQIAQKDPVSETSAGSVTFSLWDTEEIYDYGAIVVGSDSKYYRSVSAANQGNDPTTTPSLWELISFVRFYNAGIVYSQFDRVIDPASGFVYISQVDDNLNNDPASNPTEWKDQIALNKAQIETNTTNIESNDTDIADHETRITDNETDILTIEGDVSDHEARITDNESDISDNALSITTVDDKYVPNNVEKLLTNDTSASPGNACIGRGYKGTQYYGREATGTQFYGHEATGTQFYGRSATGAIQIGSTLGTASTKKLISGTKEATFEEIIDHGVGPWITGSVTSDWTASYTVRYRTVDGGKTLQIVGRLTANNGTLSNGSRDIFTLGTGYRPNEAIYCPSTYLDSSATGLEYTTIFVRSDGLVLLNTGANGMDIGDIVMLNINIPMDYTK